MNGQRIDPGKSLAWANDKEFHHFFPQAYLARQKDGAQPNLVANIGLLTSVSNISIKDSSPRDYLTMIIETEGRDELLTRLGSCLVSEDALEPALQNDYDGFLDARSRTLQRHALELCGETDDASSQKDAEEVEDSDDDSYD